MNKAPTACSSLTTQKKGGNSRPKELNSLNRDTVQNTGIHIRESYFLFLYKTLKGENSFNTFCDGTFLRKLALKR